MKFVLIVFLWNVSYTLLKTNLIDNKKIYYVKKIWLVGNEQWQNAEAKKDAGKH